MFQHGVNRGVGSQVEECVGDEQVGDRVGNGVTGKPCRGDQMGV